MLYLYQFEISHYCEKVRFILDYKGLEYKKIEITPFIGKSKLRRLSGKTKVPVLKDDDTIVADSTEIIKYLERKYPEPNVIPKDDLSKGKSLLIEAWADESIGKNIPIAFFATLIQDSNFRSAALTKSFVPDNAPSFLKDLVKSVPVSLLNLLLLGTGVADFRNELVVKQAIQNLKQDLETLSLILANRPYLTGNQPTIADFAVAGMTLGIKFPQGSYLNLNIPEDLKGKGILGLADNSAYDVFFNWRDRLYADYRKGTSTLPTP
jgi:glutathione S-transferase